MRMELAVLLLLVLRAVGWAQPFDITGTWQVTILGGGDFRWALSQSGSAISGVVDGDGPPISAEIDPSTGSFFGAGVVTDACTLEPGGFSGHLTDASHFTGAFFYSVATAFGCPHGVLIDFQGTLLSPFPCGNGIVESGEQCDDGNLRDGDGCSRDCLATSCGNGTVDPGEQCDEGAATTCCSETCHVVDPDGDHVCSRDDNCPFHSNPAQTDSDDDGVGDACEPPSPLDLVVHSLRLHRYRNGTALRLRASGLGLTPPSVLGVSTPSLSGLIVSYPPPGNGLLDCHSMRGGTAARCDAPGVRWRSGTPTDPIGTLKIRSPYVLPDIEFLTSPYTLWAYVGARGAQAVLECRTTANDIRCP